MADGAQEVNDRDFDPLELVDESRRSRVLEDPGLSALFIHLAKPDNVPTLTEAATLAGCSCWCLGQSFRDAIGRPYKRFITQLRLFRSLWSLSIDGREVKVAARDVRYDAVGSLRNRYLRDVGRSPSTFRPGRDPLDRKTLTRIAGRIAAGRPFRDLLT